MLYTYYGPESEKGKGLAHSAIVNTAVREAVRETGRGGWKLDSIDYCHEEVLNEDTKKWEAEAKVILRTQG